MGVDGTEFGNYQDYLVRCLPGWVLLLLLLAFAYGLVESCAAGAGLLGDCNAAMPSLPPPANRSPPTTSDCLPQPATLSRIFL